MKILYSKFNRERLPQFQTITTIFEDKGSLFVKKGALAKEAKTHIKKTIQNTAANSVKIVSSTDDEFVVEYVKNTSLISMILDRLKANDRAGFEKVIRDYINFLYQAGTVKEKIFTQSEEFVSVFGYLKHPIKNLVCFTRSNIDLNFDNIFIKEDGTYEFIDFEWTFDFKVPVDYVIFRSLICLYGNYTSYFTGYTMDSLFQILQISKSSLENFWSFEEHFLDYVYGKDNIYKKNRYVKDVIPIEQIIDSSINNVSKIKIYLPGSKGYSEDDSIALRINHGNQLQEYSFNLYSPINGVIRVDLGDNCSLIRLKHLTVYKCDYEGGKVLFKDYSGETNFKGLELYNGLFEISNKDILTMVSFNNDPYLIMDCKLNTKADEYISITIEIAVNKEFDENLIMLYQKKIIELQEYSSELKRGYDRDLDNTLVNLHRDIFVLNEKLVEWVGKYYELNHKYNLSNFKVSELTDIKEQMTENIAQLTNDIATLKNEITALQNDKNRLIATTEELTNLVKDWTDKFYELNHRYNLADIKIHELIDGLNNINTVHDNLVKENNANIETIHALQNSLSLMQNSTSWKITKPIRAVIQLFKK